MQITLELTDEQSDRLSKLAEKLRIAPAELAQAACRDLIDRADGDFERAAEYVLRKNRELYRRLA